MKKKTAKITRIDTTKVSVPFERPEIWAWGRRLGVTNLLIQVYTDVGVVGVGEAPGFPSIGIIEAVVDSIKPLLEKQNVFDIEKLLKIIYARGGWDNYKHIANSGIAGVEIALWDIIGKICNQSLCDIFGGRIRDKISYQYSIDRQDPQTAIKDAQQAVEQGFKTLYVKVGMDPQEDLRIVAAVREAVGEDVLLRVDANEVWSEGTALKMINAMEQYHLEFVEQPLARDDLQGMASLRKRVKVPIAANQSSWTLSEVMNVITHQAADIILIDHNMTGGLLTFKKAAAIAEAASIPVVKHSFGELGISTSAAMQIIASSPNFQSANQLTSYRLSDDVIQGGLLSLVEGSIEISRRIGIGVELDEEKVAKYADLYKKEGEFSPFAPLNES